MEAPRPRDTTLRLLAFAAVRDLVGGSEVALDLPFDTTVDGLWPLLLDRWPALTPHRRSVRIAVNGAYASSEDAVRAGDEVALIPPVAGG
ncbi:MAG TPA: MoaD/ThiS family protein [Polyangiaceae bacterium]|jgi:molybdopterin converting factor subunit 1|nr:MoaD/ThiS family protein [Polyangiaceae bacterium]